MEKDHVHLRQQMATRPKRPTHYASEASIIDVKASLWRKNNQASNRVKRLAARPKRLRIRAKHGLAHSSLGRKKNQTRSKKIGAREKNKHSFLFTKSAWRVRLWINWLEGCAP